MDFPRICPARWLSDQNFSMCMPPHDFLYPFYDTPSNYFRPWKLYNQGISKEFGSTIENEKGNYKITLDVKHFRPNDISVKVTENEIIVEGKHEERPDTHGFISRQFRRRYPLPSHCPAENVTSTMSADGILTIIAEKRSSYELEKIVPIKMCGASPGKTQIESKIYSEVKQNSIKENTKEIEDMTLNKSKAQVSLKEEHSRLLKPEMLKEAVSETNGEKMSSKQVIDILGITENKEAKTTGATSNKFEESLAKSSLESSGLTEQIEQRGLASTSDMTAKKDMCAMKGMSKTLIEESSTSYKSSMSQSKSSTIKSSGKLGECVSDIISAELKEAAENI